MKPSKLQKEVYTNDLDYNQDYIRIKKIRKILFEFCGNNNKKILDLGCGNGTVIEPFCKNNDCYGVDIVKKILKKAKNIGIKTYCLDFEERKLPFRDCYFDIVVFTEVIEHIINTDYVLGEINRILKNNAILIISFPNINQPISWFSQIFLDYPPLLSARYKSAHVRDFTLKIVKKVLLNNGFETKNVEGTFIYPFKNKLSSFLAKKIPRLSADIIVVSKKMCKPKSRSLIIEDVRKI